MKEFIAQYGFMILECVLGIISLIVLFLKKTKIIQKDTIFEKLLERLPSIIDKAERLEKPGVQKKAYVLGVCYAFISEFTGKDTSEVAEEYGDRISKVIEDILETPQKKGVKND